MSSSFSRHLNVCLGLVLRQFLLLLLFFNLLWETEYSVRTGIAYTSLWLAHHISELLLATQVFISCLIMPLYFCLFLSFLSQIFKVSRQTKPKSALWYCGFLGKKLDIAPVMSLPPHMVPSSSRYYLEVSDGRMKRWMEDGICLLSLTYNNLRWILIYFLKAGII